MTSASIANLASEWPTVLGWVQHGEEVVLLRGDTPVARVLPIEERVPKSPKKPKTPEEIEEYLRARPAPRGPFCSVPGAELVSFGRGDI